MYVCKERVPFSQETVENNRKELNLQRQGH